MKDQNDKIVDISVSFSIDGVRSAAKNAKNLEEVKLDIRCLDPKKLTIDSTIHGLKIVPVDDKVKRTTPSTVRTLGVVTTNVSSLSGNTVPDHITVNGNIDIPKNLGDTNSLENIFFDNKEDARQVALVFLEEEYNRAIEGVEAAAQVRDYLKEQFEAQRV